MADVQEFAEKVERLCRKLIAHMPADDADRRALEDLADEAANRSTGILGGTNIEEVLSGISEELKGVAV